MFGDISVLESPSQRQQQGVFASAVFLPKSALPAAPFAISFKQLGDMRRVFLCSLVISMQLNCQLFFESCCSSLWHWSIDARMLRTACPLLKRDYRRVEPSDKLATQTSRWPISALWSSGYFWLGRYSWFLILVNIISWICGKEACCIEEPCFVVLLWQFCYNASLQCMIVRGISLQRFHTNTEFFWSIFIRCCRCSGWAHLWRLAWSLLLVVPGVRWEQQLTVKPARGNSGGQRCFCDLKQDHSCHCVLIVTVLPLLSLNMWVLEMWRLGDNNNKSPLTTHLWYIVKPQFFVSQNVAFGGHLPCTWLELMWSLLL